MKSLDELLKWVTKKVSFLEKGDKCEPVLDRFARSRMLESSRESFQESSQAELVRRLECVEDKLQSAIQEQRKTEPASTRVHRRLPTIPLGMPASSL